ncbi:MAG: MerR family transcriptional regulator [Enterocloster asparagiformis]|nr:MerR family transcriptional regulator [Enterocloster asparagiformis]
MKTVKEVSELTGVSARALHWYDRIGLLKPTAHSGAGYRLYDDEALETLRQILYFREFGLPLGEIKAILESPDYDRRTALKQQKRLLELKKMRLERMISGLEGILGGDDQLDFTVFDQSEIEGILQNLVSHLDEEQRGRVKARYGSLEAYREMGRKNFDLPENRRFLQKMMEWYGSKERVLERMYETPDPERMMESAGRILDMYEKLNVLRLQSCAAASGPVRQAMGELEAVLLENSGMENVRPLLLEMADGLLQGGEPVRKMDERYGVGWSEFFVQAVIGHCK